MSRTWLDFIHKICELIFYIIVIGGAIYGYITSLDVFWKGFAVGMAATSLVAASALFYFRKRLPKTDRRLTTSKKLDIEQAKERAIVYIHKAAPDTSGDVNIHGTELSENRWIIVGSRYSRSYERWLKFVITLDAESGDVLSSTFE